MENLNKMNLLNSLTKQRGEMCISVYWPVNEEFNERDSERALTQIKSEIDLLCEGDLPPSELQPFYDTLSDLLPRMWPSDGVGSLAIFRGNGLTKIVPLPYLVEQRVVISDSFHVKPLFKLNYFLNSQLYLYITESKATLYQLGDFSFNCVFEITNPFSKEKYSSGLEHFNCNYSYLEFLEEWIDSYCEVKNSKVTIVSDKKTAQIFKNIANNNYVKEFFLRENSLEMYPRELHLFIISKLEQKYSDFKKSMSKKLMSDFRSGKIVSNIKNIMIEMKRKNIKYLIVPEDVQLWGHLDFEKFSYEGYKDQRNTKDDDIYDDLAEAFYEMGGNVIPLPRSEFPIGIEIAAIVKDQFSSSHDKELWNFLNGQNERHLNLIA